MEEAHVAVNAVKAERRPAPGTGNAIAEYFHEMRGKRAVIVISTWGKLCCPSAEAASRSNASA